MKNFEDPLPTHLDFTTLYAAALALDDETRKREALPLSRLLALSQLIESIVLHESLQYELGSTPDRWPYREALESSVIAKLPTEFGVPLLPADEQVDAEETLVVHAIKEAVRDAEIVPMQLLRWATEMRRGTYTALLNVTDYKNPQIERYLEIARSVADPAFQDDLRSCFSLLNGNEVGQLGFHVLVRLKLQEAFWVARGKANYYPHFSRQPILAKLGMAGLSIDEWTMSEATAARVKIFERVRPGDAGDSYDSGDPLAKTLSPIFLACLANAKTPEDLIDEASALRNSDAAVMYRRERDEVLSAHDGGEAGSVMLYQNRLAMRIDDLRELIFERGSSLTRESQFSLGFSLSGPSLGLNHVYKKSRRVNRFPGDQGAIFLGDVISQSLGVLKAADKIREVFGVRANYDTRVLCIRW